MADTIFAPATPQGRSGVAIIRISGPETERVIQRLCGVIPSPRVATLMNIKTHSGDVLDQALVILFETGASFTGESSAELQIHGSPAIMAAILSELSRIPSLRMADAGEFSRRALQNGKMDLAQLEGLSALLEAETEAQRVQAQRLVTGALRAKTDGWRQNLLEILALIEAQIDFADEEVDDIDLGSLREQILKVEEQLLQEARGVPVAERLRSGFEVALLGAPNTGKSTLLNKLAERDVAIISDIAGTTRDILEVQLNLKGMPVTILDTAGLRDSADPIESIGIARAKSRAETADVRVWFDDMPGNSFETGSDILIQAKSDVKLGGSGLPVSALTGTGISELLEEIHNILCGKLNAVQIASHERHALALTEATKALSLAATQIEEHPEATEIAAENVRRAIYALDQLIGRVGVEDVLGEIFSNFCIGK